MPVPLMFMPTTKPAVVPVARVMVEELLTAAEVKPVGPTAPRESVVAMPRRPPSTRVPPV